MVLETRNARNIHSQRPKILIERGPIRNSKCMQPLEYDSTVAVVTAVAAVNANELIEGLWFGGVFIKDFAHQC